MSQPSANTVPLRHHCLGPASLNHDAREQSPTSIVFCFACQRWSVLTFRDSPRLTSLCCVFSLCGVFHRRSIRFGSDLFYICFNSPSLLFLPGSLRLVLRSITLTFCSTSSCLGSFYLTAPLIPLLPSHVAFFPPFFRFFLGL